MARIRWFTFAAPSRFYALTGALLPWLWAAALALTVAGLYIGFFVAPTDAQQGESYRIIFIHVPAAWMSMVIYLAMAMWSAVGWIFNARLAYMLSRALAPTGAMFTVIALWTGALWGRPTWGTWWVWDARLTSELVLLFLYLGVMALAEAIDDVKRADRAAGLLAILGAVNVPIIYFSVQVVEHAAPGRDDQHDRRAKDGPHHADRDAADDAGLLGLRLRRRLHACPRDRAGERSACRMGARGGRSMNWGSASNFFAMGGHGFYVWGAYALTLVLMLIELWLAARRRAKAARRSRNR